MQILFNWIHGRVPHVLEYQGYVCYHWIHRARVLQIPWIFVAFSWYQILWRSQWIGSAVKVPSMTSVAYVDYLKVCFFEVTFLSQQCILMYHNDSWCIYNKIFCFETAETIEWPVNRLPVLGGAQIIAFCGLIETTGFFQAASTTDGRGPREGQFAMKDPTETSEPGNYGVGFPTFIGKVEDPEARKSKLSAELANGRLAMMAIIGMFFQDGLTGSAWGDWSLYTSSPLRAEESEEKEAPPPPPFDPRLEVGVLPPLDYFALSSVCVEGFKWCFVEFCHRYITFQCQPTSWH